MSDEAKKIFISYRRALHTDFVHRLRDHLRRKEYDVFLDIQSIPSGRFREVILHEIEARPHFVAILVPDSLLRTKNEKDWYRREIEHALETKRNIVPLFAKGFSYAQELETMGLDCFPGKVDQLREFQTFFFNYDYDEQFLTNINVLADRFLKIPARTELVPTPKSERKTIREMLQVADLAQPDPSGMSWTLPDSPALEGFKWLNVRKPQGQEEKSGSMRFEGVLPALTAPKLEEVSIDLLGPPRFSWSPVAGASGYIVERSGDQAFSSPEEVYSGKETSFRERPGILLNLYYYRVKAKGGSLMKDSPWSNVVTKTHVSGSFQFPGSGPIQLLPAPKLEEPNEIAGALWHKWSSVVDASEYVLQTSMDESFSKPTQVYSGNQPYFIEFSRASKLQSGLAAGILAGFIGPTYYRVQAKGKPGKPGSAWSNIVKWSKIR